MKPHLSSLLLLLLAAAPAMAQKTPTGSAKGNLTIDGKPIPLRYAYVVQIDDVETAGLTMMSDPTKFQVIVLSDRPLPRSRRCSTRNSSIPARTSRSVSQARRYRTNSKG
jgi:hypothetical protein